MINQKTTKRLIDYENMIRHSPRQAYNLSVHILNVPFHSTTIISYRWNDGW